MLTKLTNLQNSPQAFRHCCVGRVGLEGVGVLVSLGLSGRQARVYLALLRMRDGRVRLVAGLAGVRRQDVYGLLSELQQLRLVRQNLTVPVSYSAKPIAEGIQLVDFILGLEHQEMAVGVEPQLPL